LRLLRKTNTYDVYENHIMSIFVVVQQDAAGPEGTLAHEVAKGIMPHYPLANGVWLVSASGSARDVSDTLGITGGAKGSGVVTEVASYYGRANPAIWSWIKQNWEGGPIG
jgi:hypothetical protein